MRSRSRALVSALTVAGSLLAACTGPIDVPRAAPAEPIRSYVALGDSYTAGPFVPTTDLAGGCFRSNGNYPALVAGDLDVADFVDVSCGSADTTSMRGEQSVFPGGELPPQLDALTADTDLVTIGIGGNDLELFSTLLRTCARLGPVDPDGTPCTEALDDELDIDGVTARIARRVERVLRAIQRRAPDATVLLVGYPRLLPEEGSCPRRIPFAAGDYALALEVTDALNRSLADAADRAGVGYVDMRTRSEGHDACADEPWVAGSRTDRSAALAYHPNAAGMAGIADGVLEVLAEQRRLP